LGAFAQVAPTLAQRAENWKDPWLGRGGCITGWITGIILARRTTMAYSQISIRLGGLAVELGTEAQYPDMVSDLTNRCLSTFKEAMDKAKENGVDVADMRLITSDYGDEYEDD
jgi:hypothetical protein